MNFKENLEQHFKQFESSPILFVGSGMSKRYIGINSWEGLLQQFTEKIGENHTKIKTQSDGDMIKYAHFLAEIYAEKWWSTSEYDDSSEQKSVLTERTSPLKYSISKYISTCHIAAMKNVDEILINEVELLKKANVDGVITTNWDLFLEKEIFPKFVTFIGQDGLISGRSHGVAEIYKIHGCCSNPNSLVLTTKDYEAYRQKNPYLSSKLLTMFIERPVIFLGYSLTDPHITEILEDIINCFPNKSLDFLQNKLLFVEWDPSLKNAEFTDTVIHKKIPVKYVKLPTFIELFEVLSETKKRIPAHLFRMIKDELYELVLKDDPKGKLYVREAQKTEDNFKSTEFVVGYGAISLVKQSETIAKKGLIGIQRNDLMREVVFENGDFEWLDFVDTVFPSICQPATRIPIFHFFHKAKLIGESGQYIGTNSLSPTTQVRFDISFKSFQTSQGDINQATNILASHGSVNLLYNYCQNEGGNIGLFLRIMPYMEPTLIKRDIEDLSKILKKHFDTLLSDKNYRSNFSRLICIYDYVKNSNRI